MLAAFLAAHEPSAHDTAVWAGGALHLQIACYLGAAAAPLDAVTSVRYLLAAAIARRGHGPASPHSTA